MRDNRKQYRINRAVKRRMAAQRAREQQEWLCLIAFTIFFSVVVYLYFRG